MKKILKALCFSPILLGVNAAMAYNVPSTQTWTSTSNPYNGLNEDLIIPNGVVLTINGYTQNVINDHNVIIQPGGKLIVNNNGTLYM